MKFEPKPTPPDTPTVLFHFSHGPNQFRVVITSNANGGVVIERKELDAMGDPKWGPCDPDLDPAEMALLALAGRAGYTVTS